MGAFVALRLTLVTRASTACKPTPQYDSMPGRQSCYDRRLERQQRPNTTRDCLQNLEAQGGGRNPAEATTSRKTGGKKAPHQRKQPAPRGIHQQRLSHHFCRPRSLQTSRQGKSPWQFSCDLLASQQMAATSAPVPSELPLRGTHEPRGPVLFPDRMGSSRTQGTPYRGWPV